MNSAMRRWISPDAFAARNKRITSTIWGISTRSTTAGEASLARNPQAPLLRRLLEERGADLFNTLETYLDAGGNSVMTAELLHIHRSTVNYRLARIKAICDVDLSSASARLNLQIALKLMRLFEDLEDG